MKYENIVLIGAPGCGKSTLGKLLAEELQLSFFDVDQCIEKEENKSINDIFKAGEDHFRSIESRVLKNIVNENYPKIIATGGGVIKLHKNMELFINHSIIFFINRPVEQIASDIDISTRPLLSKDLNKLYLLYTERYPLYKKYCNYEVQNNETIEHSLDEILAILRHNI